MKKIILISEKTPKSLITVTTIQSVELLLQLLSNYSEN